MTQQTLKVDEDIEGIDSIPVRLESDFSLQSCADTSTE
jgi:hypothetical protein